MPNCGTQNRDCGTKRATPGCFWTKWKTVRNTGSQTADVLLNAALANAPGEKRTWDNVEQLRERIAEKIGIEPIALTISIAGKQAMWDDNTETLQAKHMGAWLQIGKRPDNAKRLFRVQWGEKEQIPEMDPEELDTLVTKAKEFTRHAHPLTWNAKRDREVEPKNVQDRRAYWLFPMKEQRPRAGKACIVVLM
jgi:hypothetical protein